MKITKQNGEYCFISIMKIKFLNWICWLCSLFFSFLPSKHVLLLGNLEGNIFKSVSLNILTHLNNFSGFWSQLSNNVMPLSYNELDERHINVIKSELSFVQIICWNFSSEIRKFDFRPITELLPQHGFQSFIYCLLHDFMTFTEKCAAWDTTRRNVDCSTKRKLKFRLKTSWQFLNTEDYTYKSRFFNAWKISIFIFQKTSLR